MDLTTIEGIQRQLKRLSQQICCANSSVSELPVIQSGTYTPTISNLVNLTTATPLVWQYMRVGNVVTFSGLINIEATAAANTVTSFDFDLPVFSDLTNGEELAGTIWGSGSIINGGQAQPAASNTGQAYWFSQNTALGTASIHGTYLITAAP